MRLPHAAEVWTSLTVLPYPLSTEWEILLNHARPFWILISLWTNSLDVSWLYSSNVCSSDFYRTLIPQFFESIYRILFKNYVSKIFTSYVNENKTEAGWVAIIYFFMESFFPAVGFFACVFLQNSLQAVMFNRNCSNKYKITQNFVLFVLFAKNFLV